MNTATALFFVAVLTIPAVAAESEFERALKQLTDQRAKEAAMALEPINRRHRAALEQLLQRATQAKDLDAANKIREALAAIGGDGAVPVIKPAITKNAQERRLKNTAWRESSNISWVSDIRFDGEKLIVLPRSGGQRPVDFRVGNDGSINFTWDGKATKATVSDDFTVLKWGDITFKKQN